MAVRIAWRKNAGQTRVVYHDQRANRVFVHALQCTHERHAEVNGVRLGRLVREQALTVSGLDPLVSRLSHGGLTIDLFQC